ncbi:MAG: glycosyl hydrolase 115 family protein, partial [Bacteroidales bacterium]|nr:glycosyl hydrolase 115 family protein [Bacteroidales bacterium]
SLFLLLFILAPLAVMAGPFTMVSSKGKARVVIAKGEPEFITLAAKDLVSDVKQITGAEMQILKGRKPKAGDIFICTKADPSKWESYDVVAADGILSISGTDARGTMFGIYDFIERYLKVDPLRYWNDTPYPSSETLSWDEVAIHQDPPTVKFRGWFINDEDLLTGWKESSGNRRLDYPFYSTVVNRDIMENLAEALVRCRYNLIIPASFINVANPPEKALVDICAKRGVFLSMHHIEPMGVNGYTFLNYWKDRGEDVTFSYFSNPEKMVEVWTETAKIWATYPYVIWQLGLRGIADNPIWTADPKVPQSNEGRGKLISDAIAKQIEILDEIGVPKKDRYVSTTLWMEGAALNRMGFLTFPKDAIIVFADNGPGWKWTPDFWSVERKKDNKYGVYYHHALIGDGPHLAPLTPASKTYAMMKDAVSQNTSEYAIFNVSDVREFTYNIDATTKMLWNMDSFSPEEWTREWIDRHYSAETDEWMRAYSIYYNSLQQHPVAKIPLFLDGYMNNICRGEMSRLEKELAGEGDPKAIAEPFQIEFTDLAENNAHIESVFLLKGERLSEKTRDAKLGSEAQQYAALCAQKASFELAMNLSSALYARLPEKEKPFALTTIVYPSSLMYHFTSFTADLILARENVAAGNKAAARQNMKDAVGEMDAIKAAGKDYCSGKWDNWYGDCRKIDLNSLDRRARKILESMQ